MFTWLDEEEEDHLLDIMSPFGGYTFAKDPTLENLFKASFIPVMAGTAGGLVSLLNTMPGQGYNIARSFANRADNARFIAQHAARGAVGAAKRIPGAIALGVLYGAGNILQGMYHDLSGMFIGDLRWHR